MSLDIKFDDNVLKSLKVASNIQVFFFQKKIRRQLRMFKQIIILYGKTKIIFPTFQKKIIFFLNIRINITLHVAGMNENFFIIF